LHYISGPGRWDADALAKELERSRRTIHRLLQTLSLAGVPRYFDEGAKAYRIRAGFRSYLPEEAPVDPSHSRGIARATPLALEQAEAAVVELRRLREVLGRGDGGSEPKK
jgi:predicted DNA-binding transcriptional regulator YafY